MSIIYDLNRDTKTKEAIIKTLTNDIQELYKQGHIYKALKRIFSLLKLYDDKTTMVKLSYLFNDDTYGNFYKIQNLREKSENDSGNEKTIWRPKISR